MSKDVKNPRAFSLEEQFMNFKIDDLLYGFLRGLSTVRPQVGDQEAREYLPIKQYEKNKRLIANLCGCSTKTIKRHLDRLFDNGLLEEGVETLNGKDVSVYWLPPIEGRYQIVEQDMVKYLVSTNSPNVIKIYIYLLNKYKWKRQTNEKYIFTKEELARALGYSESTRTSELYTMLNNVIMSLTLEGLISFRKIQCEIENCDRHKTTERMELVYVCEKFEELEEEYKKKIKF